MRLTGRVAIITGAGRGIGQAIAFKFGEEGAKVVVNDLNLKGAEAVVEKIEARGGQGLAVKADVRKKGEVEEMFAQVNGEYGKVDILVNNAGIRRDILLQKMSEEEWDAVVNIALKGSFNCVQLAQRYMAKQNYGKIINMASPSPAGLGNRGQANYSTANAGLVGFTKALAQELGRYNINVNCIAPDFIVSEMTLDSARRMGMYLDDFKNAALSLIPLKRLGTVEDVANVALFLASDESSFVSGQVIYVTGGAGLCTI